MCDYCKVNAGENKYHPGTCAACGAPMSLETQWKRAAAPWVIDPLMWSIGTQTGQNLGASFMLGEHDRYLWTTVADV